MDFKVGDKVRLKCCKRVREILCIDGSDVWLRCNDDDIPADEVRCTWELSDIAGKVEHIPTPPEGREVEAKMRVPHMGDTYWDGKWVTAHAPHIDKSYCLRPLPHKPEGEGWEWRKPVNGDEFRSEGGTSGGTYVVALTDNEAAPYIRLGYRWCRKKPKAKRWNDLAYDQCAKPIGNVHFIDTGTGPRLDIDKIGRAWAIEWLEEQHAEQISMHWPTNANNAKNYADMLRKEQEANNERD